MPRLRARRAAVGPSLQPKSRPPSESGPTERAHVGTGLGAGDSVDDGQDFTDIDVDEQVIDESTLLDTDA